MKIALLVCLIGALLAAIRVTRTSGEPQKPLPTMQR
jgi:hypothetical protein